MPSPDHCLDNPFERFDRLEFERRQTVTPSSAITGIVADTEWRVGREIAARARTLAIDRATHAFTDFPFQRRATGWSLVGAMHAEQGRRQRNGQTFRHTSLLPRGSKIFTVKIDTESGAASAATQAGLFRHGRSQRNGTRTTFSRRRLDTAITTEASFKVTDRTVTTVSSTSLIPAHITTDRWQRTVLPAMVAPGYHC